MTNSITRKTFLNLINLFKFVSFNTVLGPTICKISINNLESD